MNNDSILLKEEVIALDSRIKSCLVENPDEESSEYYAKIWFICQLNSGSKINGRQEFIASSKHDLFAQVRHFMQSEKNGWRII